MFLLVAISYLLLFAYCILILYYAYQWNRIQTNSAADEAKKYFVSIVLPVRNEAENILKTLSTLASQDYYKGLYEIIVVDDQSTDDTIEKVNKFIKSNSVVRILVTQITASEKNVGKKAAIAKAIEIAKGEIIITTDADCTVGSKWLVALVSPFSNDEVNMVLGKVEIDEGNTLLHKFQHIEFATLIGLTGATAQMQKPLLCNGANLAYRKSVYNEVNYYDIINEGYSGDDVFLMQKIHDKYPGSISFIKSDDALVLTTPKNTWQELIQQRKRWISKMSNYKSSRASYLGVFIFAVNLALLFIAIHSLLSLNIIPIFLFWIIKSIVDYIFIRGVSGKMSSVNLFINVFRFEGSYAIYLIRLLTFSTNKLEWKGRKI